MLILVIRGFDLSGTSVGPIHSHNLANALCKWANETFPVGETYSVHHYDPAIDVKLHDPDKLTGKFGDYWSMIKNKG